MSVQIDREWTREAAETERVNRRCVRCKTDRGDALPGTEHWTIETGELVCSNCLKDLRRFRRDREVLLLLDESLDDDKIREVLDDCFPGVMARLARPSETRSGSSEDDPEPTE
jgi:hypothetical protein